MRPPSLFAGLEAPAACPPSIALSSIYCTVLKFVTLENRVIYICYGHLDTNSGYLDTNTGYLDTNTGYLGSNIKTCFLI